MTLCQLVLQRPNPNFTSLIKCQANFTCGPSRTEAEHHQPRFGQSLTVDKVFFQAHNALPRNPLLT